MKKKNPLGLRVLSTAAIMSIITSIAAPAFAGVYYVNDGDINIEVDANGNVKVTQNGETYEDANGEVIIRGGSASDYEDKRTDKGASKKEETTAIGETYATEEEPEEEPAAEEPEEPETEPEEAAEEQPAEAEEEPEASAEEEQSEETEEAAEEPEAEETAEEIDTEEAQEEAAEEEQEPTEEEPTKELEVEETAEEADTEEEPEASAEEPEAETAEPAVQETAEGETPAEGSEETTETPAKREAPDTTMDGMTLDEKGKISGGYYVASGPKSETTGEDIASTGNTISIRNDWVSSVKNAFKFILENVNIVNKNTSKAAMSVTGQGDTTIELDGNNVLQNDGYQNKHAALEKNGAETGNLTITDEDEIDGDDSKRGSLTAATTGYSGAAIGGANGNSGENIHITGNAYVNASTTSGAAIGGGESYTSGKADGSDGNHIHIDRNAYVVAKGGDRAIGGSDQVSSAGKGGDAKDIVISGTSTVYADGGIGSGGTGTYGNKGGDTDITIEGNSTVYAASRGNSYASGDNGGTTIGSGYGGNTTIRIAGNAKVKSVISWYSSYNKKYFFGGTGVGIGGYGGTTDITIKDDAVIGDGSSSIGSSGYANYEDKTTTITISDRAAIGEMLDGTYIGTNASSPSHGEKQNANITIKDNVWIKNVSRIGTKTGNAIIKILDSVTANINGSSTVLGSSYSTADITLGGKSAEDKEEGTVTINATGGWGTDKPYTSGSHATGFGVIGSNGSATLNFGGKTKLVLKNVQEWSEGPMPFIHVKDPTGHSSYVEPTNEQMAELLKNNENVSIDYVKADGTVTKIAHSPDLCEVEEGTEMAIDTAPTCTTPGKGHFTCAYEKNHGATGDDLYHTGVVKEVEIAALGHDFGEWHVTKEATCTQEGEMQRECKRDGCTEVETKTIAIVPDAHDWGEWTTTKEATCTETGEETRVCANDDTHVEHREVPAAGHGTTHVEGKKDPTCEEPGYTGDEVCDKCGDVVKEGEDIPAKGHTPTVIGKKDPTETEPGYTGDTVCADCGKELAKGEVLPATGKNDDDNSEAPELRVVVPGNTLRDLLFTVRQAGTERTYTCKKADATLTGTLETLQYLQANGTETIVFVTNGRVSRFAVADLLALCNEGDVFYLCHTADAEPTLLIIANDHTELLNK